MLSNNMQFRHLVKRTTISQRYISNNTNLIDRLAERLRGSESTIDKIASVAQGVRIVAQVGIFIISSIWIYSLLNRTSRVR